MQYFYELQPCTYEKTSQPDRTKNCKHAMKNARTTFKKHLTESTVVTYLRELGKYKAIRTHRVCHLFVLSSEL